MVQTLDQSITTLINHLQNYNLVVKDGLLVIRITTQLKKVVQELLKRFADCKPDIPETTLLKIFGNVIELDKSSDSQLKSLEDIFSDIKNPDWKQLIVPGQSEKTWRLVDPEFQQRQQAKSQTTEKSSEPVGGGVK